MSKQHRAEKLEQMMRQISSIDQLILAHFPQSPLRDDAYRLLRQLQATLFLGYHTGGADGPKPETEKKEEPKQPSEGEKPEEPLPPAEAS